MRLESVEDVVVMGSGLAGTEGILAAAAEAAAEAAAAAGRQAEQEAVDAAAAVAAAQQGGQQGAEAAGDYDSEDEEAMIYGTALIAPAAPAAAPTAGGGGGTGGGPGAGQLPGAAPQLQRYQLKVLDSLANIGPVRDFTIAEPGAAGSEAPPCLVACSGEGKGGTLSVLRRSVVPDLITEVPLPGLLGAWAVHHRPADGADVAPGQQQYQGQYHAYLLLSFPGATKVLATGEELREVTETVEFAVDTPTLAAGSLCGGRRIAQVFPQGVRLLGELCVSQPPRIAGPVQLGLEAERLGRTVWESARELS